MREMNIVKVEPTLAPPEQTDTIALDNVFGDGLDGFSHEVHNSKHIGDPHNEDFGESSSSHRMSNDDEEPEKPIVDDTIEKLMEVVSEDESREPTGEELRLADFS